MLSQLKGKVPGQRASFSFLPSCLLRSQLPLLGLSFHVCKLRSKGEESLFNLHPRVVGKTNEAVPTDFILQTAEHSPSPLACVGGPLSIVIGVF